jgi:hypothetical protein
VKIFENVFSSGSFNLGAVSRAIKKKGVRKQEEFSCALSLCMLQTYSHLCHACIWPNVGTWSNLLDCTCIVSSFTTYEYNQTVQVAQTYGWMYEYYPCWQELSFSLNWLFVEMGNHWRNWVCKHSLLVYIKKLNSVVLVRKRTIPTERPKPAGEVSANFSW